MRRVLVAVAAVSLVMSLTAVPATASHVPDLTCGTITTSVRLREDLTCPEAVVVSVEVPTSITIDLGGHTLTRAAAPGCTSRCTEAVDIGDPAKVNVTNGTVVGDISVYWFCCTFNPRQVGGMSRVHVHGNLQLNGTGGFVRNSQIDGNVYVIGPSTTITHSVIRDGILLDDGPESLPDMTITHNFITTTTTDSPTSTRPGVEILDDFGRPDIGGTISDNVIVRASGPGIDAGDGADLANLTIAGNWLIGNGGDGILMRPFSWGGSPDGSASFAGNVAIANTGHGFDIEPIAGTIINDGGHNVALFNTTEPQCIGLICRP